MKSSPRFAAAAACATAAVLLAACSKNIQTQEAVRQGVMDYMRSIAPKVGLDLSNLQVDVPAVTFESDHARATVSVKPKGTDGSAGMELVYNLDRKGDKWVVSGSPISMGVSHGQGGTGGGALPPGHPAVGGAAPGDPSSATQLPPGHPAVGGATQLPPGHPPAGSKQ